MRLFFVKIKAGIQLYNLYWTGSLILSIIIVSSVVVATVTTFVSTNEAQFFQIPVVVQAVEAANYSDGVEEFTFPGVELAIVKEVLSDSQTNSDGEQSLEERVSLVEEQLQQPVPQATNPPETNEEAVNNLPTPTETRNPFVPTNTLTVSTSTTTRTNTLVATNSVTFTRTATNTLIPVTATNTQTHGPGNTPTFTPLPSITNTFTRTPTYIGSPTWTSSVTPSLTITPTLTNSPTKTLTLTPTWTRTSTPSLTFTPTLTNSPTKTLTFTPTWTSSVTPSLTFTPTLIPSLTPTFTLTPSLTNSPTATFTFTPTSTYTFTPTWTSSATPTRTFTPSLTATATRTPTLTPTGSSTPTETICNINPNTELLKYMWPPDGSVNVPIDVLPVIAFDQSMDLQTLTYGDDRHIVICEKITESSNSCQSGTEIKAVIEIHSVYYQNDLVIIHPNELLENGNVFTIFAGNQIRALPECSSYSRPMSGRHQINFTSVIE